MGQAPTVHLDGAGPEIAVQNLFHVILQNPVGLEQIGQRPVLAAVAFLREIDRLVNSDRIVPHQLAGKLHQALKAFLIAAAVDQGTHDDSPHIDHGVDMPAVQSALPGVDGVKGLAGGLHAHLALDRTGPVVQQGLQQQDRFHHALQGKGLAAVPGPAVFSFAANNVDPQGAGVFFRQLRNIVRCFSSGGIRTAFFQQTF